MKKTVKGIHLDINPGVFSDILTGELMVKVAVPLDQDVSQDEWRKATAQRFEDVMSLSRRIFGDKFDSIYGQLAAKHDGYVSADEWTKFLNAVIVEYQKNTDARPAPSGK